MPTKKATSPKTPPASKKTPVKAPTSNTDRKDTDVKYTAATKDLLKPAPSRDPGAALKEGIDTSEMERQRAERQQWNPRTSKASGKKKKSTKSGIA